MTAPTLDEQIAWWSLRCHGDKYAEAILATLRSVKAEPKIVGFWRDDGFFGEFTIPTSCAIAEHGWLPVAVVNAAPQPAAAPDGWVLVPKDPTSEMVMAAQEGAPEGQDDPIAAWEAAYHLMLAAAPAAPQSELLAEGPSEPLPYPPLPAAPGREG